jgi:hypothetical protein
MIWDEILENREQVFVFNQEKPDFALIENVISEMHRYMPVKQNRLLFNLNVLDNTIDETKRLTIYGSTRTSPNKYYRYNPQTLAPYLLFFSLKQDITYPNLGYASYMKNEALMQIGMAAMFINFAAIAQQLAVGFCRCITPIENFAELYNGTELIIGIGYKSSSARYFCPIDKISKPMPGKTEKKCPENRYIFYENIQLN